MRKCWTALHHSPSKGGAAESQKFQNWYEHTLESYRLFFEQEPADIWPQASEKIKEDRRHYRRVDTGAHWILRKPRRLFPCVRVAAVALMLLLALGCSPWGKTGSGWKVDGPTFLGLYTLLLGAAVWACVFIRRKFSQSMPLASPPESSASMKSHFSREARGVWSRH